MSPLDFIVTLDDKITPGANSAVASLGKLDAKLKQVGRASTQTRDATGQFVSKTKQIESAAGSSGTALEGMAASTGSAGAQLSAVAAGPVGVAVVAFLAIATAIGTATYAFAKFALSAADSKRNLMLQLEAVTGSAAAASELDDAISAVAATTPLAKSKIEEMARSLATAGLAGGALKSTLSTLGVVAGVAGEEAANKLRDLALKSQAAGKFILASAKGLVGTGVNMPDLLGQLAKNMKKSLPEVEGMLKAGKISTEDGLAAIDAVVKSKFGDIAERQMLGFEAQLQRTSDLIGDLFEDIDIEPFLKGLKDVLSIFDQSTASGKALHVLVKGVGDAIFGWAAAAGPAIKAFFQGLIIGALMIYINTMKIKKAFNAVFGDTSSINGTTVALYAGIVIMGGLALAAVVLVAALGLVAVAWFLAFLPLIILGAVIVGVIYGIIAIIDWLVGVVMGIPAALAEIGTWFAELGGSIIDGLVSGITGGIGKVISAVMGVGAAAKGALTSVLGIASPSKVFAGLGGFTAEGFAQGIDDGSSAVESSVGQMVSVPSTGAASAGASAKSGGITINTINITGVKDGEGARQGVLAALAEAMGQMSQAAAI